VLQKHTKTSSGPFEIRTGFLISRPHEYKRNAFPPIRLLRMPTTSRIMAHKTSWLRPVVHLLRQIAITRCRKHLTEIKARNSKLLYFQRHEVNWYIQDTCLDWPWSPTEHREIPARVTNWIPVIHSINSRSMYDTFIPPTAYSVRLKKR